MLYEECKTCPFYVDPDKLPESKTRKVLKSGLAALTLVGMIWIGAKGETYQSVPKDQRSF